MPPKTLIKNDRPEEVKLSEGAQVAERRRPKKSSGVKPVSAPALSEPEPVLEAQQAPQASQPKKRAPAKTRGQPRLKPQAGILPPGMAAPVPTEVPPELPSAAEFAQVQPVPLEPAPETATPPLTPLMPLIDVKDLWEQDSPVKERLGTLRARNALLTEQIQRLQHPLMGRGK